MKPGGALLHAKHVVRAAVVLAVVIITIVLGRFLFVPETWGQFGAYRGANVAEQMAEPVRHSGRESCVSCHEEQYDDVMSAGHAAVSCELCHAPLAGHVRNEEKTADMPVHRDIELCLLCHRELGARPHGFPQIQPKRHIEENEGEFHDEACFDCHEAHYPL